MKKQYPIYESKRNNPQAEQVFLSLSNKNKQALKSFLEVCSIQSKSEKRADNRRRALIKFFDFLEKDFDKITYNDYVAIAKAISESKLGVYARNTEKDFIKRFLKQNYKDANERFDNFKLFKSEIKSEEDKLTPKQLITSSDVEKLVDATNDMKYKALIAVLDQTAGRPEEILKLRYSDIDFDKKLIYLFSIKTKRKRYVPVDYCLSHLQRLKNESKAKDDDLIFTSNRNKGFTISGLNFILQSLGRKAKLNKKLNAYLFRHSRLSKWITSLSPKVYEMVAGHSLEMGMKTYAHLSQDKVITEMKKASDVQDLTAEQKNKYDKEIEALKDTISKTSEISKEALYNSTKMMKLAFLLLAKKPIPAELKDAMPDNLDFDSIEEQQKKFSEELKNFKKDK